MYVEDVIVLVLQFLSVAALILGMVLVVLVLAFSVAFMSRALRNEIAKHKAARLSEQTGEKS
jgi:hypothetical protein